MNMYLMRWYGDLVKFSDRNVILDMPIYISIESVICGRRCEAYGRLPRVSMVGHYFRILNASFPKLRVFVKNIVSAPACIYFAPRRVVRPNSIPRNKDDRFALPKVLKKLMRH